jgi:hypothetical protein
MAEIEIAILERNALSRRLHDEAALRASACRRWKPSATSSVVVFAGSSLLAMRAMRLEKLYPIKPPSSN